MIKKILFLSLFYIFFIPAITFAADQSSIGSVIMVQGQAYARNLANETRTLQRRSIVYLQDTIVTAANSKVQLRLRDDSIIVLQPSSQFSVSDFSFDSREPKGNRYVGNLVQGALINISGQGKPENYQLKSPLAAVTFRGSGLFTRLVMRGRAPIKQDLEVFSGYVSVVSICDQERILREFCTPQKVDVGAGQKMIAATIDAAGRIQPRKGGSLFDSSFRLGKTMTKSSGDSVAVQCRVEK